MYNEIEPFAAQWLRNLIAAGHIAPGPVDERSIRHLRPDDVAGHGQRHFFAGIGGWSLALRMAGWPDALDVWTGSCPCQPFSAAGKRKGTADDRHLWPDWFRLIDACRPPIVFGEQVASKDALVWLDAVFADLENAGYTCWATDLCAAGVGAPHIRQRLWWVAFRSSAVGLADSGSARLEGRRGVPECPDQCAVGAGCVACGVSNTMHAGRAEGRAVAGNRSASGSGGADRLAHTNDEGQSEVGGMGDASGSRTRWHSGTTRRAQTSSGDQRGTNGRVGSDAPVITSSTSRPGPTNGHWRTADWLYCRDDKWRPVEPGTFPLADGLPGRVGRLRAYGNAIVPQVAAEFVGAVMETLDISRESVTDAFIREYL